MSYIFGKKALFDALKSNKDNIAVVNLMANNNLLINKLAMLNIPYVAHKNQDFFKQFPIHLNHQYIVTEIKNTKVTKSHANDLKSFLLEKKDKKQMLVLIVDSLNDPQNFGAILRTCNVFGVDAVIYKNSNQVQVNDFVQKASMGATLTLNMFKVANLSNAIELLKQNNFWVYATSLSDDAKYNDEIEYENRTAIIVGNEEKGISPIVVKNSDFNIIIKMYGTMQSLNVSVATGILLFEARKQLEKKCK